MRIYAIIAAMWFISVGVTCADGTSSLSPDDLIWEPGSFEPTVDLGCIDASDAPATLTPPDLALGVGSCIKVGDYGRAVELFFLMRIRGAYDVMRVADETAHLGVIMLPQSALADATPAEVAQMEGAIEQFLVAGSPRIVAFCAALRVAGPPDYAPVYMILNGKAARNGIVGDGLLPGFDPRTAWQSLLFKQMECRIK